MKPKFILLAVAPGLLLYSARLWWQPADRQADQSAVAPAKTVSADVETDAREDLDPALAAYEEGRLAGAGVNAPSDVRQLLARAADRPPFAEAAYAYGVRDGFLDVVIGEGPRALVSRLVVQRAEWIELFGDDFLYDGVNLAVFRNAEEGLQALRDVAPGVLEKEFLVRMQEVFGDLDRPDLLAVIAVMRKHPDARPAQLFAAVREWRAGAGDEAWKRIPGWIRLTLSRALGGQAWDAPAPSMTDVNDEWSILEGRIDSVPPEKAGELMKTLVARGDWLFKLDIPARLFGKWADADYAEASAWLAQQRGRGRAILQLYEELFRAAGRRNDAAEVKRLIAFLKAEFDSDASVFLAGSTPAAAAAAALNRSDSSMQRWVLGDEKRYSVEQLQELLASGELKDEAARSVKLILALRERDISEMSAPEISTWLGEKLGDDAVYFSWWSILHYNPDAALRMLVESDDPRLMEYNASGGVAASLYRTSGAAALDSVIDVVETRPKLAPNLLGRFTVEWAKDDLNSVVEWFQVQDLGNPLMQDTLNYALTRITLLDPGRVAELSRLSNDAEVKSLVASILSRRSAPPGNPPADGRR